MHTKGIRKPDIIGRRITRKTHPLSHGYDYEARRSQEEGYRMFRQILLLTALATYLTVSSAQSLPESQWQFHMSSQMGTVDAVVTLKAEAGVLTGQFDLGNGRTWPIEEGTIEGSSINFKINRDGASMTYVMTATLEGDTAEGIASAWGSNVPWTMTRNK